MSEASSAAKWKPPFRPFPFRRANIEFPAADALENVKARHRKEMVGLCGLEPQTSCVSSRRSNQSELQTRGDGKGHPKKRFLFLQTPRRAGAL